MKHCLTTFIGLLLHAVLFGQASERKFTKADTLRGSINENRDWWNVLRYDIEVKPDHRQKALEGKVTLRFSLTDQFKPNQGAGGPTTMQLDLQQPMLIDSVVYHDSCKVNRGDIDAAVSSVPPGVSLSFSSRQDVHLINFKAGQLLDGRKDHAITIYFHGKPKEAKNAPWDGGWIWGTDSLGRPWSSVAVQGLGASAWYPCKDHQSDEPDHGASLTIITADGVGVGNGSLLSTITLADTAATSADKNGIFKSYTWEVLNPINSYNIVPSIGQYVNWTDTLHYGWDTADFADKSGLITNMVAPRTLDLSYWVLDYNLERSRLQFQQVKPMLRCFEYWFGPYPFPEDGYKLVETPFLGMEHQSAIAYGNLYQNGYRGRDLSGTGWGAKWDFIIIHESGHEWFANNITTHDIADMWVHEGFTNYSETLYTEWLFGKRAGDEYNFGIRKLIRNDRPIVGSYGVNSTGSGDMYYKAGNMIHIIRKVINDDSLFRRILRGMNNVFRHQTVTGNQVEAYITRTAGIDFSKTFTQYLRTTQVPHLEFQLTEGGKAVRYRWINCVDGFDLPLVINNKRYNVTTKWNSSTLSKDDLSHWKSNSIEKHYYISARQVTKP